MFWTFFFGFFLAYVTPRPSLSVHKKFQPNRSSSLASYREHIYKCLVFYSTLAEGPGVARGKKNLKCFENFFWIFLAYVTTRPSLSVHKKCQPNRSSRLASYREHIYECLVLLYRLIRPLYKFTIFFDLSYFVIMVSPIIFVIIRLTNECRKLFQRSKTI